MMDYIKYLNKEEERCEFIFKDFEYKDGNDLIAKFFNKIFDMEIGDKVDGIWYTIISLHKENLVYKLIWHEDVGNYMYSENQDKKATSRLEEQLKIVIDELNIKLENKE